MWTAKDCDASKNRKPFKTMSMANSRRWGARGGSWEGAGVGVEGPTLTDSLADRSDGLGQSVQERRPTRRTALGDRLDNLGRPVGRPRPRLCTRTCARAAVRLGDAVKGFASTGHGRLPDPTALHGRAHCA